MVHPSTEGDLLKDHHETHQEPCGAEFQAQLDPQTCFANRGSAHSKGMIESHIPRLHPAISGLTHTESDIMLVLHRAQHTFSPEG